MQTGGYADNQALGVEGQLADASLRDVASLVNSETSAIPYGLGVANKGDGQFEELDGAHKDVFGVTLLEHSTDNAGEAVASVPADTVGSVLRKGRVIVAVETAVSVGDEAYCRFDDGVADATQTTKGKWGADDDTNTRRHVKGAVFRSAAAKNGLAVLELTDELGTYDLATRDAAVGAIAATTTLELGAVPEGRQVRLKSAQLSAGVTAGDATDHYVIQIKAGSTVLATWDSDVAVDGAITQNTPTALNKVASVVGAPGARLTAVFTKNNAAADLTAGHLTVDLEVL
ncbi:MAG TPA: hypothetical protein VKA53_10690 [Thermoanaerobaculia bacterium]|nr:hypothetical protein [Thermoanaerobaculia bacterium]